MSHQPLIIYVSGAPGSGKTTLAEKISKELYIPHVSSDLVHGGVRFTEGKPNDRKASLHDVFLPLLVEMAQKNISFVVDHVLQRNLSEQDVIEKLTPYANVAYIHTYADDPIARHIERELRRTDRGAILNEQQRIERSEFHRQNLSNTRASLDLNLPLLEVDTTNGYDPDFEAVIAFIEKVYKESDRND
jgi:cytidylate kinase